MVMSFLLKGVLIGFAIAMPVGPIGLLCIRNSLAGGARYGFMTGLGAALADTLYGGLAGFGVGALTSVIMSYQTAMQISGGIFLCYLGFMTFRTRQVSPEEVLVPKGLFHVFLTTFFLTLTNPLTIMSFAGIYAALGIGLEGGVTTGAILLTLGVFIGSALWWFMLSSGVALLKHKIDPANSSWLNRLSGGLLFAFGITALFV